MTSKRSKANLDRTHAREQVLQLLYQQEICDVPLTLLLDDEEVHGETGTLDEFARNLACGVDAHRDEIDEKLEETSQNWSLMRMPIVDRNILRIATFELLFDDDIPAGVAINEAVELAKTFGQDESPKFVNGVLGKLARTASMEVEGEEDLEDIPVPGSLNLPDEVLDELLGALKDNEAEEA